MPPFDYNVPAELFLAKPMKGSVEIQRLYEDGEYPVRKSLSARGATE
jgi:hypothetical protein